MTRKGNLQFGQGGITAGLMMSLQCKHATCNNDWEVTLGFIQSSGCGSGARQIDYNALRLLNGLEVYAPQSSNDPEQDHNHVR